ncbi:MAG: hypothetical protein M0Z94_12670 [Dehalococcoidales bacterium]|nr:hypothetical protein [Dehalococcoidales bacterium]
MQEDVTELLQRQRAFWHREKVDRPLVTIVRYKPLVHRRLPLADGTVSEGDIELRPEMVNPETFLNLEARRAEAGRLSLGGSFSVRSAFQRIPWVEAIIGCPIWADQNSGSMWSEAFLDGSAGDALAGWQGFHFSEDNPWYRKLLDLTRLLVQRNDGSYLVGHTLMRGPIDLFRAAVGDAAMCLALYDTPDKAREMMAAAADVFVAVAKGQTALIPPFHGGYCSQFGIWGPGTVVRTQCDMSSIISAEMYRDLVLPYDVQICRQFDYSVIHLHSGFLHTVDALLEPEVPMAIEVALDTGSTPVTVRDLVPTFRKILARKPLLVEGRLTADEFALLMESLPPRGLFIAAQIEEEEWPKMRPWLERFGGGPAAR